MQVEEESPKQYVDIARAPDKDMRPERPVPLGLRPGRSSASLPGLTISTYGLRRAPRIRSVLATTHHAPIIEIGSKSQKRQGERRYWSIMLRTRACLPGSKPANIGRSPAREAFMAGSNELRLAVLEGDGIGPEITDATIKVLQAAAREARLRLRLTKAPIGW